MVKEKRLIPRKRMGCFYLIIKIIEKEIFNAERESFHTTLSELKYDKYEME